MNNDINQLHSEAMDITELALLKKRKKNISKVIESQTIFNQFEKSPTHLKQEAANYIGYLL